MRIILTILLFIPVFAIASTNYYVANSGSNSNSGTSTGSPLQTIAKFLSVYASGDTLNLNSGDSWNEKVTIPVSVYIRSYGTGSKSLITGFVAASMTGIGGNIYTSTISTSVANLNVVSINGQVRQKARYPNSTYIQGTSVLSPTQIKIPHDATNRVGKPIVVRGYEYVIDTSRVSQHKTGASFDTLVLSPAISSGSTLPYYFFQGDSTYLDSLNEWSYNPASRVLSVYATSTPTVLYSTIDTIINIHKVGNVILDNVQITGANMIAVSADSLRYDTVKNCSFNNNNTSVYLLCTNGFGITNDSLLNNLSIGYHSDPDTALYVYGNYVKNTGVFAGMGGNGYSTYTGGYNNGKYAHIISNVFKNSGYHGVRFQQQFDTLYHNYTDSFCLVKGDGGGIYTFEGTGGPVNIDSGCLVRSCIVTNGFGAPLPGISVNLRGIYLDAGTYYITCDSNTVSNMYTNTGYSLDISFHGFGNVFKNNTLVDNVSPNMLNTVEGPQPSGVVIKNNIFFNGNASNFLLEFSGVKDSTETIDSNYYLMPVAPQLALNANDTKQRLSSWQAYYPNYDIHSTDALPAYYAAATPTLYYNDRFTDSTITFAKTMVDVKGNFYNSFTLHPMQSILLFPSTRQIIGNIKGLKFKTAVSL